MAVIKTVTDEDGNEYEVDAADLAPVGPSGVMGIEEVAEYVTEVTHNPTHTGYDYVASIVDDTENVKMVFGLGGGISSCPLEEYLNEEGIEIDVTLIETGGYKHDYDLKVYFYADE